MISLIILTTTLIAVSAMIGYDCGSRSLNITTLSLLDVGQCEIPENSLNVTQRHVQLLQISDFSEIPVYQCKLRVQRTVYYCGALSHVSIVRHGNMEYIYDISRESCETVCRTGMLKFNDNVVHGIKLNSTITIPVLYAGRVKDDGTCYGATYADPYGSWDSVVVQGTVTITVQEQTARVNVENNKIHLRSGTACILSRGSCIDTEGGYTFWTTLPTDNCKFSRYGILFEGYANKIVDYNLQKQTVYALSTKDITFALTSTAKEQVCGYTIIRTDHPKLVIFETIKGESFADRKKRYLSNLDIFAYINSKFVFVERHIRTQIQQLYRDALLQRCNLERQTLKNALDIATQAPDQFAYNLMKGPGYMALTAGEVVHIIKCIPVEVKVEHGEDCYTELQVSRGNTTYFLTPRTHILKARGTKIECNQLLPSYYYVDERWYKILPRPIETRDPVEIKPLTKPTWTYVNPASLATSGIYTEKDLNDLRDHIMFPVEQPSLLNDMAREMHGHQITDGKGTITKLLNEDTLERIVESTWSRIWYKLITFGSASAGVLAIFVLIQIGKMVLEIVISAYTLHKIYGWSLQLLAALWNAVAQYLINTRTAQGKTNLTVPKNLEAQEIPLTSLPDDPSKPKSNKATSSFFSLPS